MYVWTVQFSYGRTKLHAQKFWCQRCTVQLPLGFHFAGGDIRVRFAGSDEGTRRQVLHHGLHHAANVYVRVRIQRLQLLFGIEAMVTAIAAVAGCAVRVYFSTRRGKTPLPPPKRAVFAITCKLAHARDMGEEDAMTRVRRLLAGLTAIAAMMTTDASAQECPEWLKWICPASASSNPAAKEGGQSAEQLARTTAPSGSAAGRTPKQTSPAAADTPPPARTAKAARPATSGDRRPARQGAMSDQEKDALFKDFLVWQARRPNAAANR
jgi:hypothetical protein